MKISRVKLYSFPVRGETEWLVLEISSESNQKGFSELTMSNYSQNNQLQIALNKEFKKLSGIEIYNDDQISELIHNEEAYTNLAIATSISGIRSACLDIFAKEASKSIREYLRNLFSLPSSSLSSIKLYANINRSLLPDNNGQVEKSESIC